MALSLVETERAGPNESTLRPLARTAALAPDVPVIALPPRAWSAKFAWERVKWVGVREGVPAVEERAREGVVGLEGGGGGGTSCRRGRGVADLALSFSGSFFGGIVAGFEGFESK